MDSSKFLFLSKTLYNINFKFDKHFFFSLSKIRLEVLKNGDQKIAKSGENGWHSKRKRRKTGNLSEILSLSTFYIHSTERIEEI